MPQNANLRGSILMALAMAAFALEDMFIKLAADTLPTGQVLLLLALGGTVVFAGLALWQGARLLSVAALHRGVLLRTAGEVIGSIGLITALALTPLSSVSAIMQATPLFITLCAALFLGEQVGWRRWSAIIAGFGGVLLVIRPGGDAFTLLSLFAVLGVIGLGIRDLATRMVPPAFSSMLLAFYAFAALIPTAIGMMVVEGTAWVNPSPLAWLWMLGANGVGLGAYAMIIAATRTGEISVVAPFRYTRLLFALVIGMAIFAERPDALTLLGAAVIVGSGLYALIRAARLQRRALVASLTANAGL